MPDSQLDKQLSNPPSSQTPPSQANPALPVQPPQDLSPSARRDLAPRHGAMAPTTAGSTTATPLVAQNSVTSAVHAKPRVLLIDDDPSVLQTVAHRLEVEGYRPECYARGSSFLNAVTADDVGCVVTDLRLPDVDGLELIHRLKNANASLSLILATAFADVPIAVAAMQAGAHTVLEKPIAMEKLLGELPLAIENSLARHQTKTRRQHASGLLKQLSDAERAVLELAVAGKKNRDIATELQMSPRTVDRRRQSAMNKICGETLADYAVLKSHAQAT